MTHRRFSFLIGSDRYAVDPSQSYHLLLEINLLNREFPPTSKSSKIRRDHSYILRTLDIISCLLGHANVVATTSLANLVLETCGGHWTPRVCGSIFFGWCDPERNGEESLNDGGSECFGSVYLQRLNI